MIRKFFSGRGLLMLTGLLFIGILFNSCKKNDDDFVQPKVAALMAFNLATDQPALGIALSGNVLPGSPFAYSSFTGRYLNIFPGTRTIETYNPSTNKTVDSLLYTFKENQYYSLFVTGADGNYKNIVTVDNYDSLKASTGKAYVRYINAIPDSTAPVVNISAGGSSVKNTTAAFAQVSDFIPVIPGEVIISLNNSATINANRTITLAAQKAYTVLLTGIPNHADSTKAVQIKFIENGTITD